MYQRVADFNDRDGDNLVARILRRLIVLLVLASSIPAVADTVMLQSPTGPYKVGQAMFDWEDTTRGEPGTNEPNDHRQLPVQIWYPTNADASGAPAPYRPRVEAFRQSWGDESIEFFESVVTEWIVDAPVSAGGPFPVFVFSHGWGARSSSHGTFLANVASHGYIVVGINHPYLGRVVFENGQITEPNDNQFTDQQSANKFYAEDVTFVLDKLAELNRNDGNGRFKEAIDMDRVAAGGHSSGFPAVSGAAVTDTRIRALVSFDAGVPKIVRRVGLDVPILLFRGATASYTDVFFRGQGVHPKGTIYDVDFFRVHRSYFYDLLVVGTTHNSVYDEYLFAETDADREQSIRSHVIFATFTVAYLEQVLRSHGQTRLPEAAIANEDVTLRVIPAPVARPDSTIVLPKPTGPNPVGTVIRHWVDASRDETAPSEPVDKREVAAQLW
jgi:hypothetical protein